MAAPSFHWQTTLLLKPCNYGDNVAVAFRSASIFSDHPLKATFQWLRQQRVSDGKTMGLYQVTVREEDKPVAYLHRFSI